MLKGEDYATVKVRRNKAIEEKNFNPNNEIELYLCGRWISSEEAFWKIMGFPLVDISPPTEILPVHLPGSNYMNTDNLNNIKNAEEIEILDEQIQKKKTTKLTAFLT